MTQEPHPRLDEITKDRLWLHLKSHPGTVMQGHKHQYTKAVLVEIHRELHAKAGRS